MSTRLKKCFSNTAKNAFLDNIRLTGLVAKSARSVGTTTQTVKKMCELDDEFDTEFKEALTIYAESVQEELHRRAVIGVEEDVYFQGAVCGSKTNYSDALLTTLVKAKSPEFREKLSVDTTIHGGVLLTMPPAVSQAAWLTSAQPAQLPDPSQENNENAIIDIEESKIPESSGSGGGFGE